jgi:hypothetical protein
MNEAQNWNKLKGLRVGEHVHLDHYIPNPPPPGSGAWLDIIAELSTRLLKWKGAWTVSIPVGTLSQLPKTFLTPPELLREVDSKNVTEPPAVYRLRNVLTPSTWEGEHHRWQRLLQPSVMEVISMSRSRQEAAAGDDFTAAIVLEVRSSP